MSTKHNRLWFKNRMGKRVFCNDHEHKNEDGTECEGTLISGENAIDYLLKRQKAGIRFTSLEKP